MSGPLNLTLPPILEDISKGKLVKVQRKQRFTHRMNDGPDTDPRKESLLASLPGENSPEFF